MFSQVSVCAPRGVGGVCPIACWDTPPRPEIDNPRADTPLGRHPPGQTPILGRNPPGQTTLLGRHPPGRHPPSACWDTVKTQSGMHPTGMHSRFNWKHLHMHVKQFYVCTWNWHIFSLQKLHMTGRIRCLTTETNRSTIVIVNVFYVQFINA